jgi:hypothetical protein
MWQYEASAETVGASRPSETDRETDREADRETGREACGAALVHGEGEPEGLSRDRAEHQRDLQAERSRVHVRHELLPAGLRVQQAPLRSALRELSEVTQRLRARLVATRAS